MKKITDYLFVVKDSSTDAFNELINAMIKDGWQPLGSAKITIIQPKPVISQTMVKYKNYD